MKLKSFFPILESLSTHTAADWRKDLIAGITVAVMLVPQGMAYAMLAGMPPIYGLYTGLIPLFLYAIMGTSRQMSIGPVAVSSLLVLAGVSQLAEPFSSEYVVLVIMTGLLVGTAQLLMGFLRLGFLVNFISHPVIVGFTSAAAMIIAISQLKDFFGIKIPRFSHSYETAQYAFQHIAEANWVSVAICLGGIIIMLILRKISRAIPGALLVVILSTIMVYVLGEDKLGVDLVKEVPKGLPAFQMPMMDWKTIMILLPVVFTVTVIEIVESISIAKVIQSKHGDYQIRPNQELVALGVSKIGGSFFQAIPSSGSFTRSAVNNEAGAQSGVASIVTGVIIALTLLFLTPLFYFLPKAILASIILLSVKSLFEWEEAVHLWNKHRQDFYMMLTTFFVTLGFGIEQGVMAGVVLSILMVLYRSSKPHMVVLGKLPDSINYRNVDRFDTVKQAEDILVVRFDDQLYFGNASYFQDTIQEFVVEKGEDLRLFVLDASSIHSIDSTGIHALEEVFKYLNARNVQLYVSGMIGPVRDKVIQCGLMKLMGGESHFLNVHQAVVYFQGLDEGGNDWSADAIQTNVL